MSILHFHEINLPEAIIITTLLLLVWASAPVSKISNFIFPCSILLIMIENLTTNHVLIRPLIIISLFLVSRLCALWISRFVVQGIQNIPLTHNHLKFSSNQTGTPPSFRIFIDGIIFLYIIRSSFFFRILEIREDTLVAEYLNILASAFFLIIAPFLISTILVNVTVALATLGFPKLRSHPLISTVHNLALIAAFFYAIPVMNKYLEAII
ncbi:MAG TPA: hypothetical protein PKA63_03025 [Oligoflexia bacterium]|nr:hypothetical protein [Oligoflexia bacterium]HMP47627.1 hypothetical protein [Oligoflexia bacterium]